MALDDERRTSLLIARSRAIVQREFDVDVIDATEIPGAVGVTCATGVVVHLVEPGTRTFGAAELWSRRQAAPCLAYVVEPDAGPRDVARRAEALTTHVRVFATAEDQLVEAEPVALPLPSALPESLHEVASSIRALDLEVAVDHDDYVIRCAGLEIGRLLADSGPVTIEAGVGSFDREANRVLHNTELGIDSLQRVAQEVRRWRRAGPHVHPLSGMARSAWCADAYCRTHPGAEALMPTAPRHGIRDDEAVAVRDVGTDTNGLMLFTSGIDVGLIATAADHIARDGAGELSVMIPDGAVNPAVHELGGRLLVHSTIVEISPPWLA